MLVVPVVCRPRAASLDRPAAVGQVRRAAAWRVALDQGRAALGIATLSPGLSRDPASVFRSGAILSPIVS